eukprot:g42491.t1
MPLQNPHLPAKKTSVTVEYADQASCPASDCNDADHHDHHYHTESFNSENTCLAHEPEESKLEEKYIIGIIVSKRDDAYLYMSSCNQDLTLLYGCNNLHHLCSTKKLDTILLATRRNTHRTTSCH